MKSKIYSIVISLSFLVFVLNTAAVEIPPAFENVVAQQDGNSSMYSNMSSLEDMIYPNMSSLNNTK
jgi:hypothetical protein